MKRSVCNASYPTTHAFTKAAIVGLFLPCPNCLCTKIDRHASKSLYCVMAEVRVMWVLTVSITQKIRCILQHVVLRHRLTTAVRKTLKRSA